MSPTYPQAEVDVVPEYILNTAGTRFFFFKIIGPLPKSEKTHPHSILQVPTTQLAKMSIDPKFVELTADVLSIII